MLRQKENFKITSNAPLNNEYYNHDNDHYIFPLRQRQETGHPVRTVICHKRFFSDGNLRYTYHRYVAIFTLTLRNMIDLTSLHRERISPVCY